MGITIRNALKLENLKSFQIVAGYSGIDGSVEAVGILEHEIASGLAESFFKGDFLLTSLYPIKDEPEKMLGLVKVLAGLEVSGLAVKNIYYKEIPEDVKRYADECGFPIFIYNESVCLEDIVYEVVKALKDDEDDAYLASKVHGLLGASLGREIVLRIAHEINGYFKDRVFVICFVPKRNPMEMISSINKGPYRDAADKAISFNGRVLLIHSTSDENINVDSFIRRAELNGSWTDLGTSGGLCGLDELDKAIARALSASRVARGYSKEEVSFSRMGLYRILAPCEGDYWVKTFYEETIGELKAHDKRYGSNLLETAEAFILSGGDFYAAAALLFVHVNTVRYRIGKIRELFDTDGDLSGFFEELSVAIRLHKIGS